MSNSAPGSTSETARILYDGSSSDFAMCCLLAKKYSCNAFKVADEFKKSFLFHGQDLEATITKAVLSVVADAPIRFEDDGEDAPTAYLVEALSDAHEGWCPFGEVSLIGAPSGLGKTYFGLTVFEKVRKGEDVWGHKSTPREWRALLHDRSKRAMKRTIEHMRLSDDVRDRIIRLSPAQQAVSPAEVLEEMILANPDVDVWFVEGLDLWTPNMVKMEILAPVIDALQRVATLYNVCVVATVGAAKMKGNERYFGRDALYGNSALARKVETVILLSLTNRDDGGSVRQYDIMPRNGKPERMYMTWEPERGLIVTEKPAEPEPVEKLPKAEALVMRNCLLKFKAGDEVVWSRDLGSEGTFHRWRGRAVEAGWVTPHSGKFFMTKSGSLAKPEVA